MDVAVRTDRNGQRGRIAPTGPFDLAHAMAVVQAVESVSAGLDGCTSVDVDLAGLDRIDGAGAVLLARLFDRLDAERPPHADRGGHQPGSGAPDRPVSRARTSAALRPDPRSTTEARAHRRDGGGASRPRSTPRSISPDHCACRAAEGGRLATLGRLATRCRGCSRRSAPTVSWSPAPPTCSSASSSALLGVSQLARFGAVAYVPELVVVAQLPRAWASGHRDRGRRPVRRRPRVGARRR